MVTNLEGMTNFPPIITYRYVSPPQSLLSEPVRIGSNCKVEFKIPPIKDQNPNDELSYAWLFDGKLLRQGVIEPDYRDHAVVSFVLDRPTLNNHYAGTVPDTFFNRGHIVEFYVADRPYSIPETGQLEDATGLEAKTQWQVLFKDTPC